MDDARRIEWLVALAVVGSAAAGGLLIHTWPADASRVAFWLAAVALYCFAVAMLTGLWLQLDERDRRQPPPAPSEGRAAAPDENGAKTASETSAAAATEGTPRRRWAHWTVATGVILGALLLGGGLGSATISRGGDGLRIPANALDSITHALNSLSQAVRETGEWRASPPPPNLWPLLVVPLAGLCVGGALVLRGSLKSGTATIMGSLALGGFTVFHVDKLVVPVDATVHVDLAERGPALNCLVS